MVKIQAYQAHFTFVLMIFFFSIGCISQGKGKPNTPFAGEKPPPVLSELAVKAPLLVNELGRLPDMQDGVSATETLAIKELATICNEQTDLFLKMVKQMYQTGLSEHRQYCVPLEAYFWLLMDRNIPTAKDLLNNYSLYRLLKASWTFDPVYFNSKKKAMDVINTLKDEKLKKEYLDNLGNKNYKKIQTYLFTDYLSDSSIFSESGKDMIKFALNYVKSNPRWGSANLIIKRLNSPELLDYYIRRQIRYKFEIPGYHRPYTWVVNSKFGDCDDLAFFGKKALIYGGYDVFGRIVGSTPNCHIGLGVILEDGSYLLAVHFNEMGNHMRGPYKTMLELDTALGYGRNYHSRGPFNFDWKH